MTVGTELLAGVYGRQSRNKAKSIAEQLAAGEGVCRENEWKLVGLYQDGTSASRFADKQRDDWQRVLADIEAGTLNTLILWEASRGDRTLTTWSQLLDLCRDKGVSIYVISDERLYDPRKPADWKNLARAGVDSAGESDLISVRVRRGQAGSAAAGRPAHGRAPFGYVRRYNPATGELIGQEPDPVRAPIVREVFERLAKGEPVAAIVRDFNERKVPTSGGARQWYRARLRLMAANRSYIGERTYHDSAVPGIWPNLVESQEFFAVQRILTDPSRRTTRPGRALHWLSYIGRCAPCGALLAAVEGRYRCADNGCTSAVQPLVDEFVEEMLFKRLEQPDVYEQLRQDGADDDQAMLAADNEVAELEGRLREWRLSAARGKTSPETMNVIESELSEQIRVLKRRISQANVPPEFRALLEPGVDIRVRWADTPMAARRRIITRWADIRLDRGSFRGSRHHPFEPARLGTSRWIGDQLTWRERWTVVEG